LGRNTARRCRPGEAVYFVHSFACVPDDEARNLASVRYGGHRLCAAVRDGAVFGFQFHPEKSGPVGLAIIKGFLSL
jgi:glutamine amidotransferase